MNPWRHSVVKSVGLSVLVILAGTARADLTNIEWAIRGNRSIVIAHTGAVVSVSVAKQDLNGYAGPDVLTLTLSRADGATFGPWQVPDDGNTSSTWSAGPVQLSGLSTAVPPGEYTLVCTGNSDFVFDVEPNAPFWMAPPSLQFNKSSLTGLVWFAVPAQTSLTLRAQAMHNPGVGQTLRLRDSTSNEIGQLTLTNLLTEYAWVTPIPTGEQGRAWSLAIPCQDLQLSVDGATGLAKSPDRLFTPGGAPRLSPARVDWGLLPGESRDTLFVLSNASPAGLVVDLALETNACASSLASIAGGLTSVTLPAGGATSLAVRVATSAGMPPGSNDVVSLVARSRAEPWRAGFAAVRVTAALPAAPLHARPSLYWTAAIISNAVARLTDPNQAWAPAAYQRILDAAEHWRADPHILPARGGTWTGYYLDFARERAILG